MASSGVGAGADAEDGGGGDVDGVEAHAARIRKAWIDAGRPEPMRLLFSAHGLPETVIAAGDPYEAQVQATAAAVAAKLGDGWDWTVCYQSKVGRLKWLGPSTTEEITEAAKAGQGVIVCPVAFVSEHVETLVELDHDYAEFARKAGIRAYVRVPALGVDPLFVGALAQAVTSALDLPAEAIGPGSAWRCGGGRGACPCRERAA